MERVERLLHLAGLLRAPGVTAVSVLGLLAGLGSTAAQMGIPFVVAAIVDDALIAREPGALGTLAGLLLLVAVVLNLCRVGHEVAFTWVGEAALDHLRRQLLRHLQSLHLTFFDRERSGRLHALFTEDAPQIANLGAQVVGYGALSAVQLAALLSLMSVKYGRLVLLALLLVPIYVSVPAFLARRTRAAAGTLARSKAELNSALQESLQAVREIKVFTREEWALGRLAPLLRRKQREQLRLSGLRSAHSLSNVVYFAAAAFAYWYGGAQVAMGRLTVGELVALITLLGLLENPISRLIGLMATAQSVRASVDRVLPLLSLAPERDHGTAPADGHLRGSSIHFENVRFSYPESETPALDGVSFAAADGEKIALVGPSGAGKSTLVSLLLRLYEPAAGNIRLDGRNLRDYPLSALRAAVGVVMQEPFFFPMTVRENIRFGLPEATDEAVETAARIANAHDFILQLPAGYDTEIGERGVRLSAGQRQRIGIARVVLRDPKILILDEATSELDAAAELAVHDALNRLAAGRTCLIIAHRLSTVVDADRILVLDRGRLIAQGRHEELLHSCALYRHFCDIQFGATGEKAAALGRNVV